MQIKDIPTEGYQRVVRAKDAESGLDAIISVHDTTLGPSLGGLRMWDYKSEEEALFDVNRLSRGMSFKSAVAHTGLGGGKAVILGDPKKIKSEALYLAMGRFVDSLGGTYITAEDVNTTIQDLEIVRRATKHVTGLSLEMGGSGNPSPYTAYGVFLGIRAAVGWVFGDDNMAGRSVAVQGVGSVGSELARRLCKNGVKVYGSDRDGAKVEALDAEFDDFVPVAEKDIFSQEVDVFAPCALGAIINDDTIPTLNCKIVAGGTNNPLLEPRHGKKLEECGILYAPDYVINAGGIINVSVEFAEGGYDEETSLKRIERIPQALREIWTIAQDQRIPANEAADHLAENILADARKQSV
ncbi:MAG: Glu/Leu/Phe/Val family dehydrogenase [Planctomycetota bacterium]|jgi:leucine dehydrogenase